MRFLLANNLPHYINNVCCTPWIKNLLAMVVLSAIRTSSKSGLTKVNDYTESIAVRCRMLPPHSVQLKTWTRSSHHMSTRSVSVSLILARAGRTIWSFPLYSCRLMSIAWKVSSTSLKRSAIRRRVVRSCA